MRKQRCFLTVIIHTLLLFVMRGEYLSAQQPELQWRILGNLAKPHLESNIAAIQPYRVLVIGGYEWDRATNQKIPLSFCEEIDTRNRRIAEALPMNVPHAEAALVQNGDSSLVILSGVSTNRALTKVCEYYDRFYKSWRVLGSLLIARRRPMATFISNDEILVVGGMTQAEVPIAETEIFNVKTGRSRIVTRFPYPVAGGACAVSVGFSYGNAVVIAGRSTDGKPQNTLHRYNEKKRQWEPNGNYIDSVFSPHLLRLYDDRLVLSGGVNTMIAPHSVSDRIGIETYNGFRKAATMKIARQAHGVVQWNNDSLLVLGGRDAHGTVLQQTEWVDLLTGQCSLSSSPLLNEARSGCSVIGLQGFDTFGYQNESRALVIGGVNLRGEPVSSVEMLERIEKPTVFASEDGSNILRFMPTILTSPFILLACVGFIGCLVMALLYLVRALRRQLQVEQEHLRVQHEQEYLRLQITTLQLQTLHLQMKPHFVYNSLAAVESLVLEKKTEMASHYIRVLAKLFRMVLEHSDNSTVSVQRAIDFLNVYIALEQLRMDYTFDYVVEHTLSPEQLAMPIPSMLIQPYVENAIKYGLGLLQDFNFMHPARKRMGHLSVVISHLKQQEKEYILCVVEDNGVGRAKAQEIYASRGAHHQGLSRSTRINEQRLTLLSDLQMQVQSVQYDDLADADGSAIGTRVALHIPILSQPHLGEVV